MENKEQVIEVDYDKEKVEEYRNNYIMEEEGIGADPDATPYDEQTTFNTDSLDELVTDGSTVDEVVNLEEEEGE